jgi:hypothetical protein
MDLPDLSTLSGTELTSAQLYGILSQIDLDIANLLRDGKLAALRYGVGGPAGATTDRAANLQALLAAREHFQQLLNSQPVMILSQGLTDCQSNSH